MVEISQDDYKIIERHPLGSSLDHLRDSLQEAEQSYKPGSFYDDVVDNSYQGPQKAISQLLLALMGHEGAFNLRSKIGRENIASELSALFRRVQNDHSSYEHYRALSRLVIKKAPDVEIWNAVLALISSNFQTTPPASIAPSFDGTPITHSSSSLQASEQTEKLLKNPLFHEIKHCTYRRVGGFFPKYFEGKEWTERSKEAYNAVKGRHVDGRWTDFPVLPTETAVWEWLSRFQDEFLPGARGVYYRSRTSSELTGAEARRQLDILVKSSSVDRSNAQHDWKDFQVVGELRASNTDWKDKLLQLCRYMRDVLSIQPTRRFIHGFTILGTIMELWVFDRSGLYSSGSFDIHKEPEQFIRAIAGYAMMSDEELGLDTFVERDGGDRFITITEDATGEEKRLQLVPKPLFVQRAIICRGTNCYYTNDSKCVAKFSWASDKQPSEVDLLRTAHRRGVKGVARLLGYRRIASIDEMRGGLIFPAPYQFRNTSPNPSTSFSESQQPLSQSLGPLQRLSFAETSSKKRKSSDHEAGSSKRSRSNSQRSKLYQEHKVTDLEYTQTMEQKAAGEATLFKKLTSVSQRSKSRQEHQVSQAPNAGTKKQGSQDNGEKPSKRSRFNSQTSSLHQEREGSQALENTQASSFYDPGNGSFQQRLFGCLVISPAGQTIGKFDSILQLLTALRDAIKAHRSLYCDGRILHRDISENNIIITSPEEGDGFEGMLIDLDLAIEIGERTGARHKTGTMEFMAIGVLLGYTHTYRHDLESFFYVLLWICARRAWERKFQCRVTDRPKETRLKMWYTGSYDAIAETKQGYMHIDGFENILKEFPSAFDCVKPLCREIRAILFPLLEDGALYTGTPPDPEELYGPILEAFDKVI